MGDYANKEYEESHKDEENIIILGSDSETRDEYLLDDNYSDCDISHVENQENNLQEDEESKRNRYKDENKLAHENILRQNLISKLSNKTNSNTVTAEERVCSQSENFSMFSENSDKVLNDARFYINELKSTSKPDETCEKSETENINNLKKSAVMVHNFSVTTSAEYLRTFFNKFGPVSRCLVLAKPDGKKFGFIEFVSPEDAKKCQESPEPIVMDGIRLEFEQPNHQVLKMLSSHKGTIPQTRPDSLNVPETSTGRIPKMKWDDSDDSYDGRLTNSKSVNKGSRDLSGLDRELPPRGKLVVRAKNNDFSRVRSPKTERTHVYTSYQKNEQKRQREASFIKDEFKVRTHRDDNKSFHRSERRNSGGRDRQFSFKRDDRRSPKTANSPVRRNRGPTYKEEKPNYKREERVYHHVKERGSPWSERISSYGRGAKFMRREEQNFKSPRNVEREVPVSLVKLNAQNYYKSPEKFGTFYRYKEDQKYRPDYDRDSHYKTLSRDYEMRGEEMRLRREKEEIKREREKLEKERERLEEEKRNLSRLAESQMSRRSTSNYGRTSRGIVFDGFHEPPRDHYSPVKRRYEYSNPENRARYSDEHWRRDERKDRRSSSPPDRRPFAQQYSPGFYNVSSRSRNERFQKDY